MITMKGLDDRDLLATIRPDNSCGRKTIGKRAEIILFVSGRFRDRNNLWLKYDNNSLFQAQSDESQETIYYQKTNDPILDWSRITKTQFYDEILTKEMCKPFREWLLWNPI